MLRVNVATRPFYNDRGIHVIFGIVGIALAAITALNIWALVSLSNRETQLTARTSEQETKARELRRDAARLRASLSQDELQAVLAAAREANGLIDRRVFSWTALFNYLESTLPDDVMLTAVRPDVDDGQVWVTLVVIGREVDAIDAFMDRLEETGAFADVLSRDEQARDDGTYHSTLEAHYTPEQAPRAGTPGGRAGQPRGDAAGGRAGGSLTADREAGGQ